MKKKTQREKTTKKLDDLCRDVIIERDNNTCQKCGKRKDKGLNWSHVIPRGHLYLRWDLLNSMALCARCHGWWWHSDIMAAYEWFTEKFPARWQYLNSSTDRESPLRRHKIIAWNELDTDQIESFLKEKLEQLKKGKE
jgi:hypothetical protein